MIPAAELKTGMILRVEKHLYKILATEYPGLRKRERMKGPE